MPVAVTKKKRSGPSEAFGRVLSDTEQTCGTLENLKLLCSNERLKAFLPADIDSIIDSKSGIDDAVYYVVSLAGAAEKLDVFTSALESFKGRTADHAGKSRRLSHAERALLDATLERVPLDTIRQYVEERAAIEAGRNVTR
jgi:hypothetical protein